MKTFSDTKSIVTSFRVVAARYTDSNRVVVGITSGRTSWNTRVTDASNTNDVRAWVCVWVGFNVAKVAKVQSAPFLDS